MSLLCLNVDSGRGENGPHAPGKRGKLYVHRPVAVVLASLCAVQERELRLGPRKLVFESFPRTGPLSVRNPLPAVMVGRPYPWAHRSQTTPALVASCSALMRLPPSMKNWYIAHLNFFVAMFHTTTGTGVSDWVRPAACITGNVNVWSIYKTCAANVWWKQVKGCMYERTPIPNDRT